MARLALSAAATSTRPRLRRLVALLSLSLPRLSAFLAVGLLLLFAQPRTTAQASDALAISGEYLLTGDYVVGGVDLVSSSAKNGFVSGTIPMSGVPANADITAAFLYWETISTDVAQHKGVTFRGSRSEERRVGKEC